MCGHSPSSLSFDAAVSGPLETQAHPNASTAWTPCARVIREPSSMRLFSDCMRTERLQVRNFINGEFVEPISGQYLDNIEPATGKPYSQVAEHGAHDVDRPVADAEKGLR